MLCLDGIVRVYVRTNAVSKMHTKKFDISLDSRKFSNMTVKLKGAVDMNTLMKLFDMLEKVQQVNLFLFDFSAVKSLGSSSISKILEMVERFERDGKKIAFVCLSRQVQIVFTMMGVDQVLNVFKTADDAIASLT